MAGDTEITLVGRLAVPALRRAAEGRSRHHPDPEVR
jgi:hypothetical protein